MKIKILLCILPVTLTLFSIFFINRVNAEEFKTSSAVFSIKIEKENTNFSVTKKITNDQTNKLIGGYKIVVPKVEIDSLKVMLDDSEVASSSKDVDDFYSEIDVDFQSSVIKNGETKTIKIEYSSKTFVQTKEGDFKYAYLKSPSDEYSKFTLEIAKDLGKPDFSSPQIDFEESDKYFIFSSESVGNQLIYWGSEYTDSYNTAFTLKNDTEQEVNSLISLPTTSVNQAIDFTEIKDAKYGLYDKYNNQFGVINVPPSSSKEISYDFKINKKSGLKYTQNMILHEDGLSKLNLSTEISEILNSGKSTSEKFSEFGKLVLSKYKVKISQSEYKSEKEFLDFIGSATEINSLDLAYLNCYFAKSINLEQGCQIEFGYLNLYSQKGTKLVPSFWNIIEMETETFLVDTFGSSFYGIDMYGLENDIDRIQFGTWEDGLTYVDALGFFHSDGQFQTLSKSKVEIKSDSEEISMFIQPKSPNVYSGFYHSFNFTVENHTSRFMSVKNLKYGSTSQDKSITLNEGLKIALLPKQENQFQLSKFRNINFFDKGVKEVDFTLELNDEKISEVKSSVRINYKVYDEAIIAFLILFNFVLFILAFGIWKFYFRRKV